MLWGSWNALRVERLKLLAAYSTVAQLGYLFLFFPLLSALPAGVARETAFGALVLLAITHGFAKSALFLAAGVILQRAGHDRIAELGGRPSALPVTTFTLALAGMALIGLPPSGSFLAKWQLLVRCHRRRPVALGAGGGGGVPAGGGLCIPACWAMPSARRRDHAGNLPWGAKRCRPCCWRWSPPWCSVSAPPAVWGFVAPGAFAAEVVR